MLWCVHDAYQSSITRVCLFAIEAPGSRHLPGRIPGCSKVRLPPDQPPTNAQFRTRSPPPVREAIECTTHTHTHTHIHTHTHTHTAVAPTSHTLQWTPMSLLASDLQNTTPHNAYTPSFRRGVLPRFAPFGGLFKSFSQVITTSASPRLEMAAFDACAGAMGPTYTIRVPSCVSGNSAVRHVHITAVDSRCPGGGSSGGGGGFRRVVVDSTGTLATYRKPCQHGAARAFDHTSEHVEPRLHALRDEKRTPYQPIQ